jgi:hypothetical protein
MPTVGRFALATLTAWTALTASRAAWAAPFDVRGEDWEGLSQFVHAAEVEVGSARVVVGTTLDLHRLEPADAVVLVHPTRAPDVEELSAFMHAGGRVILLDDYGTGDELLAHFHTRRRALPPRPAAMLRGNPALAIAEPGAEHPIVLDVSHVVTNHATGLDNPALSSILVVHGAADDDVVVGVAGTVGKGRLIAVGDASVVMNSMLRYPGNRSLALGLVRYGLEDERSARSSPKAAGGREGKLYVVANDFETTGAFGDDSPLWAAASEARRGLVESLETTRRDGMPPVVAYLTAVVVAIGVIVWTGARAGKTHKLAAPRFTREVPVVAQGGIAGHAAVLGAPGTSRALAVLELKSALEEELATRLGLQRAPPPEQLVARLRAMRLVDETGARALLRVFAVMSGVEAKVVRASRGAGALMRLRDAPSDADVLTLAAAVRELRGKLGLVPVAAAGGHDTFEGPL